jgi:hypothetical protein
MQLMQLKRATSSRLEAISCNVPLSRSFDATIGGLARSDAESSERAADVMRVATAGVTLFHGARGAIWSSRASPQRPLHSLFTAKPHVHRGTAPGGSADGQTVSKLECHRALYSDELLGALPGLWLSPHQRPCDSFPASATSASYTESHAGNCQILPGHISCQTAPIDSSRRAGPSGDTHSSWALAISMAQWPSAARHIFMGSSGPGQLWTNL